MIKLRKFKKLIKIIKKFKHVKSLLKCLTFKSLQLMTTVDRFCLLVSFMHSLGLIKDRSRLNMEFAKRLMCRGKTPGEVRPVGDMGCLEGV